MEKIKQLNPSTLKVLNFLKKNGKSRINEIEREISIRRKTVYAALQTLISLELVKSLPDFYDMRKKYFIIAE